MTFKDWVKKQESFACSSELDVYADWLVAPCGRSRDSDCREESNHAAVLTLLGGESETVQVLRFGHWAVGWTEMIIAAPEHAETLEDIRRRLDGYPVLDESDLSDRETAEANRLWADCYNERERLAYIRANQDAFDFRDFKDLLGCVRGRYFGGYASELLS